MVLGIFIKVIAITIVIVSTAIYLLFRFRKNKQKENLSFSFKDTIGEVGLPIVSFEHNGKLFDFIIDSGASYSTICPEYLNDFYYVPLEGNGAIFGIEGNVQDTSLVGIILFSSKYEFVQTFQVTPIPGINTMNEFYNKNVVGILGSDFLLKYKFLIDYNDLTAYTDE